MPRYPFMAARKGSKNLCYKRPVPKALQAVGRPKQIWRSLKTDNEAAAKVAYRMVDEETDALFAQWRQDDTKPVGSVQSQLPVKDASNFVPLTPALLRRLADIHYLNVYDDDFKWRGDLWQKVHEDEDAFWRGDIIKLPEDDWCEFRGKQYSYFAYLMEEPFLEDVFLYSVYRARKAKLQRLRRRYQLGDSRDHGPIADSLLQSQEISVTGAQTRNYVCRAAGRHAVRAAPGTSAIRAKGGMERPSVRWARLGPATGPECRRPRVKNWRRHRADKVARWSSACLKGC